MDAITMGKNIRKLREAKSLTQSGLAELVNVSDKAVSRWETGKGFPDFTLIPQLSEVLGISVAELMSGETIKNRNISGNVKRAKFYVCPNCGNILFSMGECGITCCGMTLPPLEAEETDAEHMIQLEQMEDELYVSSEHPMRKEHFLSFIAWVTDSSIDMRKLYPEGSAQCRFPFRREGILYVYCNHHGLMRVNLPR